MYAKAALGFVLAVILANYHISGTMYGSPVSIPALLLVFVIIVSVTLLAVVLVVRKMVREVIAARSWSSW